MHAKNISLSKLADYLTYRSEDLVYKEDYFVLMIMTPVLL